MTPVFARHFHFASAGVAGGAKETHIGPKKAFLSIRRSDYATQSV